jgi:FkbM family methyltransferase
MVVRWRRAALLLVGAAAVVCILLLLIVGKSTPSPVEAELRRIERQVERLARAQAAPHAVENVFIDCGAAGGDSIRAFLSGGSAQGGDFGGVAAVGSWNVFAFEPNERFTAELLRLPAEYPQHRFWIFNNTAVSTRTELVSFHINPSASCGDCGSSLLSTVWRRVNHDGLSHAVTVPAVDLATLMLETFSASDTVVLKMDIEGSEGALLSRLLGEGVVPLIDVLYVEWHRWAPDAWLHRSLRHILAPSVDLREWK